MTSSYYLSRSRWPTVCKMDAWRTFFRDLSAFIDGIAEGEHRATANVAESVVSRISNYQRVLGAILTTIQSDADLQGIHATIIDLQKDLEEIKDRWMCIESGVQMAQMHSDTARRVLPESGRGRPRVVIEQDKIEFLRELGFNWTQIASMFGVCRRTLYAIRDEYGILSAGRFTQISDDALRHQVQILKQEMPEIGYNMMRGILRSWGIHVSTSRIQQCISEIDPINTALRWAAPTSRRHYAVPYPNFIWHIDGNHKLVR